MPVSIIVEECVPGVRVDKIVVKESVLTQGRGLMSTKFLCGGLCSSPEYIVSPLESSSNHVKVNVKTFMSIYV